MVLKNEVGGHRIQRVPQSEHKGRVHSSTVTVACVSAAKSEASHKPEDFLVSWYSGSGCGGQHRNKTQNSVRITHIPTGITKKAETRSRENSYQVAMAALVEAVDKLQNSDHHNSVNHNRRSQVGSGERSDKRRTYRFQEGMVYDHTTGKSANIGRVMSGNFDLLW